MEAILQKVTQQAMNYAIRSGIVITSSFAINQCGRLLKSVRTEERDELSRLQHRLDAKIRIIAPAIDMIELIAARGNTSLESAVSLTKSIRWDMQALGVRLQKAAADEEMARRNSSRAKPSEHLTLEVKLIIKDIRALLDRIEDAVPLINLAITTSGVSLSTNLPPTVSPSRLLQASTFLSAGDSQYGMNPQQPTQIGPRFTTSVYMLFMGHSHHAVDEEGLQKVVWKEVIHKAHMKLVRVPIAKLDRFPFSSRSVDHEQAEHADMPGEMLSNEFAYQLTMIEDLDDGRFHDFEEFSSKPGPLDDVDEAGIRTQIPIHQISKIFYADTGKILNIGSDGEINNPVLLLKRDPSAPAPRRLMERAEQDWDLLEREEGDADESHATSTNERSAPSAPIEPHETSSEHDLWNIPPGLDPEWIALEVFNEGFNSDDESDSEPSDAPNSSSHAPAPAHKRGSLASAFSSLRLTSAPKASPSSDDTVSRESPAPLPVARKPLLGIDAPIATSLSLLEMLIRLTSLQQFQQSSHLAITDELLNFFLSEGSTTGAASGDAEARKRIRMVARQHVGFDPYDESPIKRRGEEYQQYRQTAFAGEDYDDSVAGSRPQSPLAFRNGGSLPGTPLRDTDHPLLRRHSSTPKSTPPLPESRVRLERPFPMTPPGTNSSRARFLRQESGSGRATQSSPLAKVEDLSSEPR